MTSVLARYEALLASGELRADAEQSDAAERLDRLQRELESAQSGGGLLGKLFAKKREAPREAQVLALYASGATAEMREQQVRSS